MQDLGLTSLLPYLFGGYSTANAAPPALNQMPPPDVAGDSLSHPIAPPQEAYRSDPYQPTTLGAALEPPPITSPDAAIPIPRPRPADAPTATQASTQPSDALLKSLRGVTPPAPPQAQKVATPHLPALRPIQGGQYLDLLASLGVNPQAASPGLKLPSTLSQALGLGGR